MYLHSERNGVYLPYEISQVFSSWSFTHTGNIVERMTMKTLFALFFAALLVVPTTAFAAGGRSTNPAQGDFLPAHNFKVEIDGVIQGGFKEITGLESGVEVIEPSDDDPSVTQKRPGRAKFNNIVMKRGYSEGNTFFLDWFKKVLNGTTERKSGSIVYLDREGNEVLRYNFFEAWPCRWGILPAPNPLTGQSYVIEKIEIAIEKVERAK